MASGSKAKLGELQLAIMRELWTRGEATVADVHQALRDERGLALTTIATMLRKMEQKGVVDHREDGRTFVYRPLVHQHEVHRTMVGELTEMLFQGSAAALVSHLLTEQEIDPDELARLKSIIDLREREMTRHDHREGEHD